MINEQQWSVFRYRNQERKSWPLVAELMNIEIPRAKEILKELRKQVPELFPVTSEHFNLGKQLTHQEREDYNAKIVNIDTIAEEDIQQKF